MCVTRQRGRHKNSIQQCVTSKTRTNLPKKSPSQAPTPPLIHTATFNGQKLPCAAVLLDAWNYSRTNLYDIGHFLFMAWIYRCFNTIQNYRAEQSSFQAGVILYLDCECVGISIILKTFPLKCEAYMYWFSSFSSQQPCKIPLTLITCVFSKAHVYMLFFQTHFRYLSDMPWLYIILKLRF